MRKIAFFLLLATAAAPAFAAQDQDRGGRHHRNDSAEPSESRPQRANRSSEAREQRSTVAVERQQSDAGQQSNRERAREHFQQQQQQQTTTTQSDGGDSVRNWRRGDRDGATSGQTQTQSGWRERERRIRTIPNTQPTSTQPSRSEREAFQSRNRRDYRDGNYTRWSNNWRHDRRYDWRSHRNRHRSIFHLGFYYDPFGWNYRNWSIGSFLYPSYYGSRYWLNDPWQYRLPPAYGPYRWIRYWDDALLVNIYTGEVVDVMHNFFW
jgi:hypothetical protein